MSKDYVAEIEVPRLTNIWRGRPFIVGEAILRYKKLFGGETIEASLVLEIVTDSENL